MKKIVTTLSLAALFAVSAQADFARFEVGAGMWKADPSGSLESNDPAENYDASAELGYDEENTNYVWVLFKHPVPVIPNIRLEYTDLSFSGALPGNVIWDGNTFDTNGDSTLNLKQYDATLYYNLLDNTAWTTLDLGLDFKYIDAAFTLHDPDLPANQQINESENLVVPMAYLRARVEVPATDLAVEGDIKYIGYNDSKFYDARIKLDYTLDFVPVVQPALEVGYRVQKLKIDEDDFDVKADIDFSGLYAGLMLRF
jgi:outer membrane protein